MATQKQIAEKLGVSVSLVSRALSGKADEIGVPRTTTERICDMAVQLGYVPSAAARILKGAPSRTIGVITYDFDDPFLGLLLGELQRQAKKDRYSLILTGFDRRAVSEEDIFPLLKHDIDGLIILGSETIRSWPVAFTERKIPVVRIGGGAAPNNVHVVCLDEQQAMRDLLEHLAGPYVRTIGFIGDGASAAHRVRKKLFIEQAAAFGLEISPDAIVVSHEKGVLVGLDACGRLLNQARNHLPDAIIAASDMLAFGCIRRLSTHGLRMPQDVLIVGYDDSPPAQLMVPALTSVRQPIEAMCREAIRAATSSPRLGKIRRIKLPSTLIIRESSLSRKDPSP